MLDSFSVFTRCKNYELIPLHPPKVNNEFFFKCHKLMDVNIFDVFVILGSSYLY